MPLPTTLLPGGLLSSSIGMGTAKLGDRLRIGDLTKADASIIVQEAIESGVRLFDTGEIYGGGFSEELLGYALKGRRQDVLVATKFGPKNSNRALLISACEASLRRLNTDTIDIYQSHWPNPAVPIEETVEAMASLVKAGKVRALGFSNVTSVALSKIAALVPENVPIATVQQEYSLIERFVERHCLPFCRERGYHVLGYSPLAQGKLAGAHARAPLPRLASDAGVSTAVLALAWTLRRPGIIPIPESTRLEGLRDNIAAATVRIPEDIYRQLEQAFSPSIEDVPVERIRVVSTRTGSVYTTLEAARRNELGVAPSPLEVAKELEDGEMLKAVKVRPRADMPGHFDLFEGQIRFWAWQIAHGAGKPIPAWIESFNTTV